MADTLTLGWALNPDDAYIVVQATRQMSQGVLTPTRGSYRELVVINTDDDNPFDLMPSYLVRFGRLIVGRKIFIRYKTISDQGLASTWQERNQTVT